MLTISTGYYGPDIPINNGYTMNINTHSNCQRQMWNHPPLNKLPVSSGFIKNTESSCDGMIKDFKSCCQRVWKKDAFPFMLKMYVKVLWLLIIITGRRKWRSDIRAVSFQRGWDQQTSTQRWSAEGGLSVSGVWVEPRSPSRHLERVQILLSSVWGTLQYFKTWNKPRETFYYGSKCFLWTDFTQSDQTELLQLWSETRKWVGRCHSNVIWGRTLVTQE